jgi:hypothetical protein
MAVSKQETTCNAARQAGSTRQTSPLTPLQTGTEGTANFLVNRRMNKSQQMRWSRRGADRLLQVRCALYNGTLGTGFGQKFLPANDPHLPMAVAA